MITYYVYLHLDNIISDIQWSIRT